MPNKINQKLGFEDMETFCVFNPDTDELVYFDSKEERNDNFDYKSNCSKCFVKDFYLGQKQGNIRMFNSMIYHEDPSQVNISNLNSNKDPLSRHSIISEIGSPADQFKIGFIKGKREGVNTFRSILQEEKISPFADEEEM